VTLAHPRTFTVQDFQAKWRGVSLKERSASQSRFNDLCRVLGVPSPTEADPTGSFYAFERGAEKTDGGQGWADVWFRGHFAWEYKGQRADLRAAYRQLRQYVEDLDNPPLLVFCDLDRFEVRTSFTGTAKKVYAFAPSTRSTNPRTWPSSAPSGPSPTASSPSRRSRPSPRKRRLASASWPPASTPAASSPTAPPTSSSSSSSVFSPWLWP